MPVAITPLISDPRVSYRLDPGEPGVAQDATATTSVYTVVGQESRNRARLASEAMLQGRDVVYVGTTYDVKRVGSFTVVVGGHTKVVTRSRAPQPNPLQGQQATSGQANGANGANGPNSAKAQPQTAQKVDQLYAEQRSLEREKAHLETQAKSADAYEASQAKMRLTAIELRLKEIKTELSQLTGPGATGANANQNPAAAFAANGLNAALNASGQLLNLIG